MTDIQKKITDLVPSLSECQTIPAGEFTDTIFLWREKGKYGTVQLNDPVLKNELIADGYKFYPAPTFEEIIDDIEKFKRASVLGSTIIVGNDCYDWPSESQQALGLWFRIREKHKK